MLSIIEKTLGTLKYTLIYSMLFAGILTSMRILFDYYLFSYTFYELVASLAFGVMAVFLMQPWRYYGNVRTGVIKLEI